MNTSDARRVSQLLRGHAITQVVAAAVRLGIPDHLARGPLTVGRLSELTAIEVPILRRYLRALAGLGIVEASGNDDAPDEIRGTALCALLNGEGACHGNALMSGGDYYAAWGELDFSLRTGESAFERVHGCTLWERFAESPDAARSFARTMRANTQQVVADLIERYDFPTDGVVADLGAGDGTLIGALLARFPGLRGLALEQPTVVEHTRRTLTELGVADRCEVLAGNLRAGVPRGADLYILKSVVHNWKDDDAIAILRTTRAAMRDASKLLVIERALDPTSAEPLGTAMLDLTMLVLFGARDRTADEYGSLLEAAGFTRGVTLTTPSGMSLLEARVR